MIARRVLFVLISSVVIFIQGSASPAMLGFSEMENKAEREPIVLPCPKCHHAGWSSFWNVTAEPEHIYDFISPQIQTALDQDTFFKMRVYDQTDQDLSYEGLFWAAEQWELLAWQNEMKITLQRAENEVMLETEELRRSYPPEAFALLVPFTHFQVLADMFEQNQFKDMQSVRKDEHWEVRLATSAAWWLEELFNDFLFHHAEQEQFSNLTLAAYDAEYVLHFKEMVADQPLYWTAFEFVLQKDGTVLEQIKYEWIDNDYSSSTYF